MRCTVIPHNRGLGSPNRLGGRERARESREGRPVTSLGRNKGDSILEGKLRRASKSVSSKRRVKCESESVPNIADSLNTKWTR